jgi:hypothetical protein
MPVEKLLVTDTLVCMSPTDDLPDLPKSYCTACADWTLTNPGDRCARCGRPYTIQTFAKVRHAAHAVSDRVAANNAEAARGFVDTPGIRGAARAFRTLRQHPVLLGLPLWFGTAAASDAVPPLAAPALVLTFWLGWRVLRRLTRTSSIQGYPPGVYRKVPRRPPVYVDTVDHNRYSEQGIRQAMGRPSTPSKAWKPLQLESVYNPHQGRWEQWPDYR